MLERLPKPPLGQIQEQAHNASHLAQNLTTQKHGKHHQDKIPAKHRNYHKEESKSSYNI